MYIYICMYPITMHVVWYCVSWWYNPMSSLSIYDQSMSPQTRPRLRGVRDQTRFHRSSWGKEFHLRLLLPNLHAGSRSSLISRGVGCETRSNDTFNVIRKTLKSKDISLILQVCGFEGCFGRVSHLSGCNAFWSFRGHTHTHTHTPCVCVYVHIYIYMYIIYIYI